MSGILISIALFFSTIAVGILTNWLYDVLRDRGYLPPKPNLKFLIIALSVVLTIFVFVAMLPFIFPLSECQVSIKQVDAGKSTLKAGETTILRADVDNPQGDNIVYSWQARLGILSEGVWTTSLTTAYTAPEKDADDTVTFKVLSYNKCEPIEKSTTIKVVSGVMVNGTAGISAAPTTTPTPIFKFYPAVPSGTESPPKPTPTNTEAPATPIPTNNPEPPTPTPTNILGSPTPTLDCSPLSLDDSLSKGVLLAGNVEFIFPSEKCGYIRENQPITVTVTGADSRVSVWLIAFEPGGNYLYPHQCTLAQSSGTDFRCVTPQMEMFSSYVFSFVLADAKAADFLGSHNSFEVRDLEGKGDITELRRILVKLSQ